MEFEDVKAAFWDPAVEFEVQVPLTEAMVVGAEETLGVQLPEAYLALLRIQNGGYTTAPFRAHPAPEPTSWASDHVPFDSMFGIGATGEGILRSAELSREWGMPDGLVLLTGDGHWWIALDYRRSGSARPPSVVWYDNEMGEDIQLAGDFETFVESLRSRDEFDTEEVASEPRQVESAWIDPDLLT
jgi:SMI1-KNR4 cell-wall